MSETRIAYARRELMLYCVTQAIPFRALENEHFINYVKCLHPLAPIHSRRQIGVTELNNESRNIQSIGNRIMGVASCLSIGCDGWTNGRKCSILAFSAATEVREKLNIHAYYTYGVCHISRTSSWEML
jgi:hypothetical protein